jgi:P27 family predicted phage terminase small subunit
MVMGKPGPKPKPPALKVVAGERKDRIPDAPPADVGELTRPSWLSAEAKREWNRLVPQLERWGLGAVDRMALAMLCQEWARYVECQREMARVMEETGSLSFETPKGYVQQIPEVGMSNKAFENVRKMCAEFGLTLSSRGRITVPGERDGSAAERLLS